MKVSRDKRELTERNRKMLAMRKNGMMLREIAAVFKVSEVRVHEICRREEYLQRLELRHTLTSRNPLTSVT